MPVCPRFATHSCLPALAASAWPLPLSHWPACLPTWLALCHSGTPVWHHLASPCLHAWLASHSLSAPACLLAAWSCLPFLHPRLAPPCHACLASPFLPAWPCLASPCQFACLLGPTLPCHARLHAWPCLASPVCLPHLHASLTSPSCGRGRLPACLPD